MSERTGNPALPILLICGTTLLFSGGLVAAFVVGPPDSLVRELPGLDNQPAGRTGSIPRTGIGSWYRVFGSPAGSGASGPTEAIPAALKPAVSALSPDGYAGWPRFRGPSLDNSLSFSLMPEDYADLSASELLWSRKVGEGHAGAAVYGNRAYLLDYDEERSMDLLRCFDLRDGTEYWQLGYPHPMKRNHGLSRSIPTVNERFVVTIGPEGHLMCAERSTGRYLWGADLANDWKSSIPLWYTAQCALLEDDIVIFAPAAPDALLAACRAETGEILWKTPNPSGWKMSHSSVMKARIDDADQYVYAAVGGISGVHAKTGELLWQSAWKANVVAPSPVILGNRIFQTAGYGAGSIVIEVNRTAGGWSAETVAEYPPTKGLACEQQTPVVTADGLLLGIMPKDGGGLRERLVCSDTSGSILWSSDGDLRFGLGPFLRVGDRLFVLDDDGTLSLLSISRAGPTVLDTFDLISGGLDSWAPLAMTGNGYLVARDSTTLVCYRLGWEENP